MYQQNAGYPVRSDLSAVAQAFGPACNLGRMLGEFGTERAFSGVPKKAHAIASLDRYDRLSRVLHWAVAAGIIYTMLVGYGMHFVSDAAVHDVLSMLNMSVATVVAGLMVVRFIWRFFRPALSHGDKIPSTHKAAAHLAHEVFYIIIFCVLVSGFLMLKHGFAFFGLIEIPRLVHSDVVNDFFFTFHRASCIALGLMLALHIAAVVKHQWVDKYPILSRML